MSAAVHILLLASLIFQPAKEFPDLALSCGIPANAKAEPVEMPRAEAYIVGDSGGSVLEDRYDVFDLWYADSMRGRWRDADGNRMSIGRIRLKIPGDAGDVVRTRRDFAARYADAVRPDDLEALDDAVYLLSPVEVSARVAPRRSQRQNLAALWRYETTNANAFVYAFRPRGRQRIVTDWYLVSLVSDEPDAPDAIDRWLDEVRWIGDSGEPLPPSGNAETGLLAEDYRRNIVNYGDWHFTAASNVVVVDNIAAPERSAFISALTNGLPKMQAAYRAALPSPLADDTHIAAVRIFDSRSEYLDYVGWDMQWSAALWSPQRRELVMFYPMDGASAMLRTVWHEALHQHLDYACSMLQMPPWFNEGHAVLFENSHFDSTGRLVFDVDREASAAINSDVPGLAGQLPALLAMDYADFYAGSDEERRMKYRLAWSLAYFLQVGAPEVRFQPFRNLRSDLMKSLVRTRRRSDAMRDVMGGEMTENLIKEWISFWKGGAQPHDGAL